MLTDAELSTIAESPYKADFPLLAANPGLSFLDSAATAQRPAVVLDAERRFYETMNANPLRGLYRLSVEATAAIDDARAHVASFIGAVDELLRAGAVTALYITHRLDEIPPSIQRVLRLDGKGRASEETLPPGGRLPGRARA